MTKAVGRAAPDGVQYFLGPPKDVAYLEIKKSGCTSMKHFVAGLSLREVPEKSKIHGRFPRRLIRHRGDFNRARYFTFTFVRHPVDRFFSFYRGKVLRRDRHIEARLNACGIECGMERRSRSAPRSLRKIRRGSRRTSAPSSPRSSREAP